ncbi:hypothetical protein HPU229334_00205 [Helicobacter pullorum]|uniref:Uncharacterized protein n=1 Tax=Helicobacter pullorum TaxID=35818 RepID=A0A0N0LSH0_9HELI|nr:hypothetical protein [Helicobacter pullorum]KPH54751.1 hypothetical protein HPU229334_00205 [Helicobacter pullorum]
MLGRLIKKIFLVFITIGAVNVWASVNGISLYDRYELWASINGTSLYDKNRYELIDYIVENKMLLVITSNLIMQTKESSWRDSIKIFMDNIGVWGMGSRLIRYKIMDSFLVREFISRAGYHPTDKEERDAREVYSTFGKTRSVQIAILGVIFEELLQEREQLLAVLEDNLKTGVNAFDYADNFYQWEVISLIFWDMYNYLEGHRKDKHPFSYIRWQKMIDYRENSDNGRKFNYNEWAKIRGNVK